MSRYNSWRLYFTLFLFCTNICWSQISTWPCSNNGLLSTFCEYRAIPVKHFHTGIDIRGALDNSFVLAAGPGTIVIRDTVQKCSN